MELLLKSGRSLYTDNFYTSVDLAHQLMKQKIHLIGTLHSALKLNPKPVITTKLSWGEMIMRQSNTNVIVGKWRDNRDILFLITKSVREMIEMETGRGVKRKPLYWYLRSKGILCFASPSQENNAVPTFNTYIDAGNAANVEFKGAPEHKLEETKIDGDECNARRVVETTL
ncbi:Transposase IS4 [Popillia japonica]|uniref:Transposase IS4 n=1 Tax=Popillia japonica TaxID=7064 RepID=A0AAW1JD75_POPJA